MRRFPAFAFALVLSACATAPQQQQPQPAPVTPAPQQPRGDLIGFTAGDLLQRFGQPALQVREGQSVKLQFRGPSCVLDAYLYPPPNSAAPARVTYIDARLPSGVATGQTGCIAALEAR